MLPENNTYGAWPASGEIDIIEARGNGPTYPAQGSNFVRSSLNYGPLPTVLNQIYGWFVLFYLLFFSFPNIIQVLSKTFLIRPILPHLHTGMGSQVYEVLH